MKCERCNNEKVWVGNFISGGLVCEHCINDDDLLPPLYKGDPNIVVECKGGGGGSIGTLTAGPGGGGGAGGISAEKTKQDLYGSAGGSMTTEEIEEAIREGFKTAEQHRRGMPRDAAPPPRCGYCGGSYATCQCGGSVGDVYLKELPGVFAGQIHMDTAEGKDATGVVHVRDGIYIYAGGITWVDEDTQC